MYIFHSTNIYLILGCIAKVKLVKNTKEYTNDICDSAGKILLKKQEK